MGYLALLVCGMQTSDAILPGAADSLVRYVGLSNSQRTPFRSVLLSPRLCAHEQYPTSAHIAAHMIYTMDSSFDDISDNVIADFGCGGGILGIACDLLGAAHVVGVDIDSIALDVARRNADTAEVDIDLIRADICGSCPLRVNSVDVVVMNPPFGTRNKGVDMGFVFAGLRVARKAVYSLHKSSTRAHVVRSAEKHGYGATVVAELRYDIPAMYKFHKSRSKDIAVDFIRFSIPDSG